MTGVSDARRLTVELEARPGPWHIGPHYEPLDGWLYNGDAPGPLIEARLGDTLVVRLTNALPEPTSLAWSGSPARTRARTSHRRMPAHPAVQPQETREYCFPLNRAGTFWYHAGGDVTQIERGLHGVLTVRPAAEPGRTERIIVLDDICLGRRTASRRHARGACPGNVLLMNGRVQPQLVMCAATVEHWRVINVTHARSIRFSLGGAPFRRMDRRSAATGDHLRATRAIADTMLHPGDTADLIVGPFDVGARVHVQSLPHVAAAEPRSLAFVFGTVLIGG